MQLAKTIFLTALSIMKKILDLIAFKCHKDSDDFKFYKKQIMSYFYDGLRKLFASFSSEKIIKKCSCNADLKDGYKECDCGGSGFINYEKE